MHSKIKLLHIFFNYVRIKYKHIYTTSFYVLFILYDNFIKFIQIFHILIFKVIKNLAYIKKVRALGAHKNFIYIYRKRIVIYIYIYVCMTILFLLVVPKEQT